MRKYLIFVFLSFSFLWFLTACSKKSTDSANKIAECYKFADEHWIETQYRDWLKDSLGIQPDANGEISDTCKYWDPETGKWTYLSHRLPDKKTDQYYEMIGKYDQFKFGWDDFPDELEEIHRNEYLECLDRATKSKKLPPTRPA